MLSSASVSSRLFDLVKKSALPHPTSAKYSTEAWRAALVDIPDLTARDANLFKSAVLLGDNIHTLKTTYFDELFRGLTPNQALAFSIADANRSWVIVRHKSLEAQKAAAAKSDAIYTSTLGRAKLDVGPMATHGSADMLNTTFVDCVPHWLSQARYATFEPLMIPFDYSLSGPRAQLCFSLEHAFKEIWLQIYWEPWDITRTENGWLVTPVEPTDRGLWSAWGWRDEALAYQHAFSRMHFGGAPSGLLQPLVHRVASALDWDADGIHIVTSVPTPEHEREFEAAMITLETSYLGEFADEPLSPSEPDVTLRRLELATRVIQDVALLFLHGDVDVEYRTEADIERISCAISEAELISLLSKALSITETVAAKYLNHLVSKPFDDMNATFRNGLWHRPLVSNGSDGLVRILAGALVWASPVRRFERWLQEANKFKDPSDLSKTPLGIKYENATRHSFGRALAANPILGPASSPVSSISARQAAEEIDGLVRIGSTILVLEVKCFLSPSDPIDRHNYLRKLEKACVQANRKAEWMSHNLAELEHRIGELPASTNLRFVPLVVVNQSAGVGCCFDGCVIVDALFLSLFLGDGSIRTGAARDFGTPGRLGFVHTQLYQSVNEAEEAIPSLFETHPGIAPYRAAVDWDSSTIPLRDRSELQTIFPVMNGEAFTGYYPPTEDILPPDESEPVA